MQNKTICHRELGRFGRKYHIKKFVLWKGKSETKIIHVCYACRGAD